MKITTTSEEASFQEGDQICFEVIKCPDCNGLGEINHEWRVESGAEYRLPCKDCSGTGLNLKLKKIV